MYHTVVHTVLNHFLTHTHTQLKGNSTGVESPNNEQ